MLLKELEEEVTYLYHPDHLGSVSVVSNHRGLPYERVEYLPFGEVWIEETDPATGYIPFRFTSKELDEETGLYYHGARYYEPTISRWMSADPAGWELINPMDEDGEPVPDGWPEGFGPGPSVGMKPDYSIIEAANWYAYVSNNPVIYVDPTGMADILFFVEGEAAYGLGVDGSAGIVIDTDELYDSGINVAGGYATGYIAGIGVGAAFFLREVEGIGTSFDVNLVIASVSIYFDDQGFNGFAVTRGPGMGVAGATLTISETLSIGDMRDAISNAFHSAIDAMNSTKNRFFNLFLPMGPHRSPLGSRNEN